MQTLRAVGLSPDILVCRCQQALLRGTVEKLSLFCMVPPSHVISVHDVSNIYQVGFRCALCFSVCRTGFSFQCLALHPHPPPDRSRT